MVDRNDVVQIKLLEGVNQHHHKTFVVGKQDSLDKFSLFLEGLVQTNAEISAKDHLELNVK